MVNAAILTGKNDPDNAPWLVDIELPRVKELSEGSKYRDSAKASIHLATSQRNEESIQS